MARVSGAFALVLAVAACIPAHTHAHTHSQARTLAQEHTHSDPISRTTAQRQSKNSPYERDPAPADPFPRVHQGVKASVAIWPHALGRDAWGAIQGAFADMVAAISNTGAQTQGYAEGRGETAGPVDARLRAPAGALEGFRALVRALTLGDAELEAEIVAARGQPGQLAEEYQRVLEALGESQAGSSTPSAPRLDQDVRRRRLQSDGSTRAYNRSATCSGVGFPQYAVEVSPSCNGVAVSLPVFAALTAARAGDAGATAQLAAAVVAAGGVGGGNASFGAIIPDGALLPADMNLTALVPEPQATIVRTILNVTTLEDVRNVSQLFPAQGQTTAATAALMIALGPTVVGAVANATVCTETNTTIASCVCPLDYLGDACEWPRHFQCSVTLADPVFHACVNVNAHGFVPPASFSGLSVAMPDSPQTFIDAIGRLGVTNPATTETSMRVPLPRPSTSYRGYRTLTHGQPPCMFVNRAQDTAAPLQLAMRVSCAFLDFNVSSNVLSGQVLADAAGVPYTARMNARRNSTAGLGTVYVPPLLPPQAGAGVQRLRCNGSVMTTAFVDNALAARGQNRSTVGAGAPWYGLSCLEQAFTYAVGGPDTPGFALSNPPALPIGLVARALPSTYLSDRAGTGIVSVPLQALLGSQDVTVAVPTGSLPADAGYWQSGRLHIEARVVHVPEPTFPGFDSASSLALEQLHAIADAVTDTDRMNVSHPLLLLSSIHRLAVDDVSYSEPVGKDVLPLIYGLVFGLALPVVLSGAAALWWRRFRARRKEEAEVVAALERRARAEAAAAEAEHERMLRDLVADMQGATANGHAQGAAGAAQEGVDGGDTSSRESRAPGQLYGSATSSTSTDPNTPAGSVARRRPAAQ